jgi:murein DD-endopeptidase MepM/ murein hydrolase activator NlpD
MRVHFSAEVTMRRFFGVLMMVCYIVFAAAAQSDEQYVIFEWRGSLYAQSVSTGEMTQLGPTFASITAGHDVYTTPIPSTDDYGFAHGVWSPNRSNFAYLEIAPPHFRLRMQTPSGENLLLVEDQLTPARGYLDPIGWTSSGDIVLLERRLLNHLHEIKIWTLDPAAPTPNFVTFIPADRLSGRSAVLPDGASAFVGFNLAQNVGFLIDLNTGQARTFITQSALPPAKGFEYHPLQILGAVDASELANLTQYSATVTIGMDSPAQPAPFLRWPLPDDARDINCYTDSAWTIANFEVTCPGLSRRVYEGHEGTDIGGDPNGLPVGTPVYPAAPGTVVATYVDCIDNDPSCNNAYGNTVTLEHILIDSGQIQVWYTGYGHLQTPLVESGTYLEDLTQPLGLSGATGIGGAHLHFEVRHSSSWVDPWDNRSGASLWLGSNARPLAAVATDVSAATSEILVTCTSTDGNNIRNGPSTIYDAIGETSRNVTYNVLQIAFADIGEAQGDWYLVQFDGGEGWLWHGVLDCQ